MTHAPVGHAAGAAVPLEMQQARRWLHWAAEPRRRADGTTVIAKVPYYVNGSRRYGDLEQDAARLSTYADAVASLALWGSARAGLGFALGDGWQGVDLDKISDRPALAGLAGTLPSYVERSPSGTGLHAIGYGAPFSALGSNRSGIEAYSTGRFFTVTGDVVRGGPLCDLSGYVASVLAPLHAAGRRTAADLLDRGLVSVPGDETVQELADALRYLDADDRDTWVGVGQELYGMGEAGYALWSAWSGTAPRFPGGDDLERWNTFRGDRTGYQGVFVRAAAAGWKNPRKLDAAAIFAGSGLAPTPAPVAQVIPFPSPSIMAGGSTVPPPSSVAPSVPVVPPVPDSMPAPAERMQGQQYRTPEGKQREAALESVIDALREGGVRIAYDSFQDAKMLADGAGGWRPVRDVDLINMRMRLGAGGFKPVKPEIIKSAVEYLAHENSIDTAVAWIDSLKWDEKPRVDMAMIRYYGWEDSIYSRAVGAYLFTALAGRALVPGIKADMAVILVGMQGTGKTTAVSALAPSLEAFGEINLQHRDDNLARQLRGKLIVEWAEMRGMSGRDQEGIKAWISRTDESWIVKYSEYATRYRRRCIVIGTANTDELLDDPTGERRWLPGVCGQTDVAALRADLAQLWAEGAARFRQGGIEWELAQRLARDQHLNFKVWDDWTPLIEGWLDGRPMLGNVPSIYRNGEKPFQIHEIATAALNIPSRELSGPTGKRIGAILRNLGYEKLQTTVNGKDGKFWKKASRPSPDLPL